MDSEQRKEFFNTLAKFVAVQSVEPAEILDRLARREPPIKRSCRGKEPDIGAYLFRVLADVKTGHLRGAVGRLKNGSEETEGGGLPRAIGAEQAVDVSGLAAEVYAINSAHVAAFAVVEDLGKVDGLNHRLDDDDFN